MIYFQRRGKGLLFQIIRLKYIYILLYMNNYKMNNNKMNNNKMNNKLLVIIAPGYMPLPAPGWGAVERIVWDYYENLKKREYNVRLVNNSNHNSIIQVCNNLNPEIIHIMYDDHISVVSYLNCKNIYYTSHFAYITHTDFENQSANYFNNIFKNVI